MVNILSTNFFGFQVKLFLLMLRWTLVVHVLLVQSVSRCRLMLERLLVSFLVTDVSLGLLTLVCSIDCVFILSITRQCFTLLIIFLHHHQYGCSCWIRSVFGLIQNEIMSHKNICCHCQLVGYSKSPVTCGLGKSSCQNCAQLSRLLWEYTEISCGISSIAFLNLLVHMYFCRHCHWLIY